MRSSRWSRSIFRRPISKARSPRHRSSPEKQSRRGHRRLRDLFDLLRAARDPESGAAFDRAELRDQVGTMIVAGHETTALTLFWSLYLLASAPAEQEAVA